MPEIERLVGLAPQDFAERFERPARPVVLAGAASHFAATRRFSPDYLSQKLGNVEIRCKVSATHLHPDFHADSLAQMFATERSTFADFMRAISEGPERARRLFTGDEQFLLRRRDGQTTVNEELKVLLDDVEVPPFFPPERLYTVWAWFSGPGVRTWLHYDNNGCHNLNAQLTGNKRCALYPPSELRRLYPFLLGGQNPAHNCSQIDVEAPDAARFPNFGEVEPWRAELEPGDLLFIPACWFHTFLHLGEFNSNI
ncbi:MAG TPA: cupin-like domain-containing protein, partial [Polyangiaceae bacterium]|nr:cupin-like domain-containing protein [Polyangiaceae bacterium]